MKKTIIYGLLALVIILGVITQNSVKADGYPTGAETYPHSTGICNCGKYPVCHPLTYVDSNGNGHVAMPGQTTFPPGSSFPGNAIDYIAD